MRSNEKLFTCNNCKYKTDEEWLYITHHLNSHGGINGKRLAIPLAVYYCNRGVFND